MQLFEFKTKPETDITAFYAFMRKEYPDIIGRKRFCCHLNENTDKLREDCNKFKVYLKPIPTFVETTFTESELDALKVLMDTAIEWGYKDDPIFAKVNSRSPIYFPQEMEWLHYVVEWVAARCGGGDDTIGALIYTGAARKAFSDVSDLPLDSISRSRKVNDKKIVDLAKKIESHEDYDLRENG